MLDDGIMRNRESFFFFYLFNFAVKNEPMQWQMLRRTLNSATSRDWPITILYFLYKATTISPYFPTFFHLWDTAKENYTSNMNIKHAGYVWHDLNFQTDVNDLSKM